MFCWGHDVDVSITKIDHPGILLVLYWKLSATTESHAMWSLHEPDSTEANADANAGDMRLYIGLSYA